MGPSKDIKAALADENLKSHDITVIYLRDAADSILDNILETLEQFEQTHEKLLKYVAITPVKITR